MKSNRDLQRVSRLLHNAAIATAKVSGGLSDTDGLKQSEFDRQNSCSWFLNSHRKTHGVRIVLVVTQTFSRLRVPQDLQLRHVTLTTETPLYAFGK